MKRNRRRNLMNIFPIILLVVSIFMSLGYATVNSVLYGFSGDAVAKDLNDVFITNISSVDSTDYKVSYADNTILKSNIGLDSSDLNSTLSLKISFYNKSNYDYVFKGISYASDLVDDILDVYSNDDIIYTYDKLDSVINIQVVGKRGGTAKLYINGSLISSFSTGSAVIDFKTATIGDLRPGRGLKLQGTIYDVALYNRALTASEVTTNWEYAKKIWNIQ